MILVILDGLGDERNPKLGGKTPLEYISKELKTLNRMASEGYLGMVSIVDYGIPPSSDMGHLAIFGYDLERDYPGRGYFEALGMGLDLEKGDVAFRTNFATVRRENNKLIIVDRRAGRISGKDAEVLAKDLSEEFKRRGLPVEFIHTVEHRGVLVIKSDGKKLSNKITDTDPHEIGAPVLRSLPYEGLSGEELEAAKRTAEILNEALKVSYEFLDSHPLNKEREEKGLLKANVILARGAGIIKDLIPFKEKWGVEGAFVAGGPLYKGVARAIGLKEIHVEGATGTVKTNLKGKVEGTIKALDEGYEFVFLHIKGTDTLSHDKKAKEKAEFIKKIDEALAPLLELENVVIAVTGDHSTSSLRGHHIGLPVPIVFWTDGQKPFKQRTFDEATCSATGELRIFGKDILPLLLDFANRTMELGFRPSPKPVFYTGFFSPPLEL